MRKCINYMKSNLFLVLVILLYSILMIVNPEMGWEGVKNSGYYIKEMLMIMPVIFILTSLLDCWVPKETIMKLLGKEAKMKGSLFSFILGSISAGPIYAAFPFCVMLHKKGASIKNIVIILSSWAVIKIPMLINEVKFLGLKFMALRWLLTVIAIILFASITDKIVKDSDLKEEETNIKRGAFINKQACMGCRMCTRNYPELFEMNGAKAQVKNLVIVDEERLKPIIASCPVRAISYTKE